MSSKQPRLSRAGRPREQGLDERIIQAAQRIIERGEKVTVDSVVQESGASRASVYRRWPSLTNLVAGALDDGREGKPVVDVSGTIKDGLIKMLFINSVQSQGSGYTEQRFRKRIELTISDPKLQQVYWRSHVTKRRETPLRALELAKERGEIRQDADIEAALDAMYGTFYYQLTVRGLSFHDRESQTRSLKAFEMIWSGMQ